MKYASAHQRKKALAKHLEVKPKEIVNTTRYDDFSYSFSNKEFLVLEDIEAVNFCRENIEQSLFAFNTDFLMAHAKYGIPKECFDALKEKCEDGNNGIKCLINDFDHFVDDAVLSDGRGHFISSYDGEEHEVDNLYIYRTN